MSQAEKAGPPLRLPDPVLPSSWAWVRKLSRRWNRGVCRSPACAGVGVGLGMVEPPARGAVEPVAEHTLGGGQLGGLAGGRGLGRQELLELAEGPLAERAEILEQDLEGRLGVGRALAGGQGNLDLDAALLGGERLWGGDRAA